MLIFYVIYLGLILPFVCWGAMGTPGHPHPVAHFVFAVPTIAHSSPHPMTIPVPRQAETDSAPVGQSRPDTTLISLLLLVFVSLSLRFGHHPHRFSRLGSTPKWRSIVLPIPTPPPRRGRMANGEWRALLAAPIT